MYARYISLPHSIKSGIMLWLIFTFLLSACGAPISVPAADGIVLGLHRGTADWIISGCVHGECGTQMWIKDGMTIYARPLLDGFAFTGDARHISGIVQKMEGGNFVNWATWDDFRAWMQQEGWQVGSMKLILSVAEKIRYTLTILVIPVGSSFPDFIETGECDTLDGICNWEPQP